MDKKEKTKLLLKGVLSEYEKEKHSAKAYHLFQSIVGLKFKLIRLEKNITVESVVQDISFNFNEHSVYKFEKGDLSVARLFALSKYYNFNVDDLFSKLNKLER
jgi:carbonic anhydrase|tara:strand:- start:501 stop:809 length:309 start_codon:yes stop_codon:yes gene_type:complete